MKKTIFFIATLLCLSSCIDTAVEQLNKIKKPCTVFSKNTNMNFYDINDQMTIKDANGNLIELNATGLHQLCNKYNVGDTIK